VARRRFEGSSVVIFWKGRAAGSLVPANTGGVIFARTRENRPRSCERRASFGRAEGVCVFETVLRPMPLARSAGPTEE